jgi:hypothetical protein
LMITSVPPSTGPDFGENCNKTNKSVTRYKLSTKCAYACDDRVRTMLRAVQPLFAMALLLDLATAGAASSRTAPAASILVVQHQTFPTAAAHSRTLVHHDWKRTFEPNIRQIR